MLVTTPLVIPSRSYRRLLEQNTNDVIEPKRYVNDLSVNGNVRHVPRKEAENMYRTDKTIMTKSLPTKSCHEALKANIST